MARVQLLIPDDDRDRFVHQAKQEGMTLSAWLRKAARQRLAAQQRPQAFESADDLEEFFQRCDELEGAGAEPDWGEHLTVIEESRGRGASTT